MEHTGIGVINPSLRFINIPAKLDPYMQLLYDNLAVIQNQFSENEASYLVVE